MDNQEEHTIKFVILTQEILADEHTNAIEKIVLARICGFDEFFESSEKTTKTLHTTPIVVQRAKRKLEKLGYIEVVSDTGRGKIYRPSHKKLWASSSRYDKKVRAASTKKLGQHQQKSNTENKERIKREYKGADAPADEQKENQKESEQPKQYGNAKVNEFLETWLSETGDDFSKTQRERRAAHNLIQSNEPEALRALLTAVGEARRSGDRFAPQIAAPSDLVGKYSKLNKLRMWVARQQAGTSSGEEPFIPDFDGSKPAYWFYPEPTDEERAKVKQMANEMRKSGKYSWLKPKGEGNEPR